MAWEREEKRVSPILGRKEPLLAKGYALTVVRSVEAGVPSMMGSDTVD